MIGVNSYVKRKQLFCIAVIMSLFSLLCIRVVYLMTVKASMYTTMALEVQQRERRIKAARGLIYDRNGKVIASNSTVCSISVIHSQIKDANKVIRILSEKLGIDRDEVEKKINKISVREIIKTNVPKNIGDEIRNCNLSGVKIDEDYKRYYPYGSLASKVLGFTGGDNQGIVGLEVKYDSYMKGTDGFIMTPTDAKGIEDEDALETRLEPIAGNNLWTSLDVNIQMYAEQIAYDALETKKANYVSVIVMNPNNGEILAMVNAPEFDLNNPYKLNYGSKLKKGTKKYQNELNKMWRNQCINDTYEPGSTFKIVTAAAALEEGVVKITDNFYCPGYKIVDDRRIRCHKVTGHGSEDFVHGTMNSCNPVFIEAGLRLGVDNYYKYLERFGLLYKTGIDLPGEAGTIIHKKEKVGNVELATMSFGQSFQITPIRFLATAATIINGGNAIIPHIAVAAKKSDGKIVKNFDYPIQDGVLSKDRSDELKGILEKVVSEGTGNKAYIEGIRIGGKTATSQKLPRNSGKYIASFMSFAPADDPKVISIIIVDEPKGTYYGGTVVGPMMKKLNENILPYLLDE
ncbi:MAG: peptidoglycan glycosyltransferase [Lachnospiraceae bacterium]|nr:peptidoglycan glycosyltransferase [Lachnospiraceae bacterium]